MGEVERLAAVMAALGVPDPDGWARSEVAEGIAQAHRALFLRAAWDQVVPPEEDRWMEAWVAASARRPDAPFAGRGAALGRLLAAGADRGDLAELVRGAQGETLVGLCALLGDPGMAEAPEGAEGMGWTLVAEDGREIGGLVESALAMEPGGREMRPG